MEFSILNGTDEFPYPLTITRNAFADNADFDPDTFLYTNHRFTSLDSLISDLTTLSKTLNQDLLDLVNEEYSKFIQLGMSIDGCLEQINNISLDVGKFNGLLDQSLEDFTNSSAVSEKALNHKKRLNLLKNRVKLVMLLHEQCSSFETLLGLDVGNVKPEHLMAKLSTLATLYLSVTKIHAILTESPDVEQSVFFEKVVKTKVVSLKFEFKLYLDELFTIAKSDSNAYGALTLRLLHVYRVTGHSSDLLALLHKRT